MTSDRNEIMKQVRAVATPVFLCYAGKAAAGLDEDNPKIFGVYIDPPETVFGIEQPANEVIKIPQINARLISLRTFIRNIVYARDTLCLMSLFTDIEDVIFINQDFLEIKKNFFNITNRNSIAYALWQRLVYLKYTVSSSAPDADLSVRKNLFVLFLRHYFAIIDLADGNDVTLRLNASQKTLAEDVLKTNDYVAGTKSGAGAELTQKGKDLVFDCMKQTETAIAKLKEQTGRDITANYTTETNKLANELCMNTLMKAYGCV